MKKTDRITDDAAEQLRAVNESLVIASLRAEEFAEEANRIAVALEEEITERRRAEAQFRRLLESAPDPILGIDAAGRILFLNAQVERVFGYPREALLRQSIEMLLPDQLREQHGRLRSEYLQAPTIRPMGRGLDLYARRQDGSELPVEISLSPVGEGDDLLVIAIVRDISDRRQLEAERARFVAERTRAQEAIERLKDNLWCMIVHDLKNPVNGISMMVQLALRKGQDLPEAQRNYLTQIGRTCRDMMRLIQNILEISKIEAGDMPIAREPVVLAELVNEVIRDYSPVAEEGGRQLQAGVATDLPVAEVDRMLLLRVLRNLLVNALRHSGSKDIRIEGEAGPGPAEVTLSVTDYGQGIPVDEQGTIFEKFYSGGRSPGGEPEDNTGLGLSFCKLAVERMGGCITLQSTPGERTTFTLTLPVFAGPDPRRP